MYYRNPDYLDVGRLTRELQASELLVRERRARANRSSPPLRPLLSGRLGGLVLSTSMIALPAMIFFLFLGVSRLINAL
ncbi:MAG TPA: hypothetical protein VGM26_02730 [Rhizomicrobium sp.]|jgi:hypothetical protein